MVPSLRQIKLFQAVVELGSFSKAAEQQHTSQAGVSHAIRELETLLGARLFDRTTRSVELTEAGRLFATSALPGLAEIEHAVSTLRDFGELKAGLVRVAAPPFLGATVLPRLVVEAEQLYPKLGIRIDDIATDQIAQRVRAGLADLGVGTFGIDEDGLESSRALRDQLMAFVDPSHPFVASDEVNWSRLQDQRLIVLTRESGIRVLTEIGFEQAALTLRPYMEVHQIHTALSLAELGAGVAVLPSYALAFRSKDKVAARPLTLPTVARDISIISGRGRTLSPAAVAIRGLLRKVLKKVLSDSL